MRKFWVVLEDEAFDKLDTLAKGNSMSIGTYTKELVMKHISDDSNNSKDSLSNLEEALAEMKVTLEYNKTKTGCTFTVADLVKNTWNKLTRSEKMICSKTLKKMVDETKELEIASTVRGVNFYKFK